MFALSRPLATYWSQLGSCRHQSSDASSQQSGAAAHNEQQLHTQPDPNLVEQPTLPEAQQLSEQQQQELKRAIVGSFKRDSAQASNLLVASLNNEAKRKLLAALEHAREPPDLSRTAMVDAAEAAHDTNQQAAAPAAAAPVPAVVQVPEPTFKQLLRVAITKGLPFVAFGFFDNIIMITAGEQIDLMFGAKLGLSSMAAAGLGNTVADVVGINISHTIEHKFKSMKSMAPALTKAQLALPRTQRAKWLGCAIGMASGCLLGLTPLLFYDVSPAHKEVGSTAGHSNSSSSSNADIGGHPQRLQSAQPGTSS